MQFLLFLTIFLTVNADLLNEFSADVDYYDMGIMGRGKNAASWHHSYEQQEDVFYYLAMQPWRHLVWTRKGADGEYYKYIINEDASNIPKNGRKLERIDSEDYCRKEYAHEIRKFEIDWSRVPKEEAAIETVDINGQACFKYPGKLPLVNVYLDQRHINAPAKEDFKVCRMEFIGGRSLTFRSFNGFSQAFISDDKVSGYMQNLTKCNIDPSPNNLDSDLYVVMGISDTSVVREVLSQLKRLGDLTTIKKVKLYTLKGESYSDLSLTKEELKSGKKYESLYVQAGTVDALINVAKNDMVAAMKAVAGRRKGTMVVLIDRELSSTFDAETAFDRNNITVHVVGFNSKNDASFRHKATSLLSLGEHYHEFTTSSGLSTAMTNLFKGIRVNLTERCDRTKCNGFCDGRDRCTCPMCCENDCFYTYCDVNTASCTPWPKAEPKKKIECAQDCVGKRECKDLVGCIITEYNPGCAPKAKCQRAYCNATSGYKCAFEDTCGKDTTPSSDGYCYSYQCDTETGMCKKKNKGAVGCHNLEKTNCQEYYCTESLQCKVRNKVCVKTSPYIEMSCYEAKCNERTGQCENKLSCDNWVGCGETNGAACRCDSSNNFQCTCLPDDQIKGYCKTNQICDTTGENPECKTSPCKQDLTKDSTRCRKQKCNEETLEVEWESTVKCDEKIKFVFDESSIPKGMEGKKDQIKELCLSMYSTTCGGNDDCKVVDNDVDPNIFCGRCAVVNDEKVSLLPTKDEVTYTLIYKQDCGVSNLCTYPDGSPIEGSCDTTTNQCHFPLKEGADKDEVCINCIARDLDCAADGDYRSYYYYENTGDCELVKTEAKGCNVCNKVSGYFESNCVGDFEKTHLTSDVTNLISEKTMTYRIPKVCMYGSQCVPQRNINCMPTKDDGSGIYEIWQLYKGCNDGHDGYANGVYHYSEKFDEKLYATGQPQTDEFVKEAEKEAYCEWTLKTEFECSTCDPDSEESSFNWVDNCPPLKDGIKYQCIEDENGKHKCDFDPNVDCPPRGCTFYKFKDGLCVRQENNMCHSKVTEREEKLEKYKGRVIERFQDHICVEEPECKNPCSETDCPETLVESRVKDENGNPLVAQSSCDYETSDNHCIEIVKNYERGVLDFGCYKPVAECDDNTYRCKYAKIVNVEDDVDYFLRKSNVVLNNKCYGYECVEEVVEGKWTHSWKLKDEFIAKQNPEARHKCETAICDPETGEPKYTEITCNVEEQFPTISGNQSECFYCQCSYTDGSFVLSMFADTDEKTYSLDACGSCIVTDRESGKVLNEVPPCVLKQELNLTGAIAGATVAASVVFALVGAMAVVSIGLFQTYQLVTSALKNAITTTVENAEFVAADNEATNVLNAGDD